MPPAPPDSSVGRAGGPVEAARRIRTPHRHRRRGSQAESNQSGNQTSTNSALETLLVDLGCQIHRGVSQESAETPRFCPTGLEGLDAHLGGGFPIGGLSEIYGVPSSGRMSLALALLAETLGRGVLSAWIDPTDAFDPISAAQAGSDLDRLLWVRARSAMEALRSCERLLQTEGFELVILDLASLPVSASQPPLRSKRAPIVIHDTSWLRLARLAAKSQTALVTISNAPATGSRAGLVLEMKPLAVRFIGPPSLLDALETTAVLQRHRSRPSGQEISLLIHAEEADISPRPSHRRKR
jgi:hypothetical protein